MGQVTRIEAICCHRDDQKIVIVVGTQASASELEKELKLDLASGKGEENQTGSHIRGAFSAR